MCVDCHGHNPPEAARDERFRHADGIQCEACHGPAENWLRLLVWLGIGMAIYFGWGRRHSLLLNSRE